ncbi:hypothetical protein GGTG_14443 [Gaeumannomyces tritici R3-111a-1]|uniref:Uncharacterized protein n=1 Tax=Gaeumannomyces tritici (strain R3-111a-1) TaxID=644352 RepID=J3PLG9_GAET3|nr:hypothetical protein GGTG_14443 [Gaeumannomyces tritici R3-111a-1]EJT67980.1 hypothetical protein GGTG_14443 [Gaeumannomyces tritici R3-111a-1]
MAVRRVECREDAWTPVLGRSKNLMQNEIYCNAVCELDTIIIGFRRAGMN